MKTFLSNVFSPSPTINETDDQGQVDKNYRYWRIRIFYSMFIGYAFYYFSRKSFIYTMPSLIENLGFSKSELGILVTVMALTYGLSKFVSGVFGDNSNPRYLMAFGLIITGILNVLFGFSSSLMLFTIFWGLNGFFQGFGWAPCARLLTQWYSQNERGRWWASWNVSHNLGGFCIPLVVGASIAYMGDWRWGMYVPGIICILVGFFLINRLRDTPQSLGLPPIEKFRNDYSGIGSQDAEETLTPKQILIKYVLKNKYIWLLAFAYFFVYVVRAGVDHWSALYLKEAKNYSTLTANTIVSLFEAGGFCGSLFSGWASDRLFGGKRGPVNVIFTAGIAISLALFCFTPEGYIYLDSFAMFLAGFMIFGPQMLIGMMAAELSHKRAAASASGFAGWFAYMGAASAGYPLAKISQEWGWDGFFWALAICCGIAVALLIPLWSIQGREIKSETKQTKQGKAKTAPA